MLRQRGVSLDGLSQDGAELAAQGKTAMYISIDGQPAGLVAAADQPRPSAQAAITQLKQLGLTVAIISGDNQRTAEAVGRELGIDRV
jgi:P-type E1-E2 ATPase